MNPPESRTDTPDVRKAKYSHLFWDRTREVMALGMQKLSDEVLEVTQGTGRYITARRVAT